MLYVLYVGLILIGAALGITIGLYFAFNRSVSMDRIGWIWRSIMVIGILMSVYAVHVLGL